LPNLYIDASFCAEAGFDVGDTERGTKMREEFVTYQQSRFNDLLSIEIADQQRKSSNSLERALQLLGPIFARHEMQNTWGLSLLHNHWTVEDGELPIQDITEDQSPRVLETLPRTATFEKDFWPSIFAVSDGRTLQPLEFTSDESVREANRILDRKPDFKKAICDTLVDNGLLHVYGLAVLRNVSDSKFQLVEFNYEGRISVLREATAVEIEGKELIQTAWKLCPDENMTACQASCFSQCIVPASGGGHTHAHPKAHKP
jgi:hypothetical protein